jgi:glycosyltransferase involved in cell wall biosynthesis
MKISVALCTYNGGTFLHEQLDSLTAQSRLPDEVVICDDGSTDETLSIIEQFIRHSPFAVNPSHNKARLNVTRNFERAIGLCRFDLIALCDQDDVWAPHKLRDIEAAFAARPTIGMAFSDARLIDERGAPRGWLWQSVGFDRREQGWMAGGRGIDVLMRHHVVTGATAAIHATLRDRALPIPDGWLHDGWLALCAAVSSEITVLREPLIDYRLHAANQIGVYRNWGQVMAASADSPETLLRRCNEYQVALDVLSARLGERIRQRALAQIRDKIAHTALRAKRAPRLMRLTRLFGELASGRYHANSRGWRSFAKDSLLTLRGDFAPISSDRP